MHGAFDHIMAFDRQLYQFSKCNAKNALHLFEDDFCHLLVAKFFVQDDDEACRSCGINLTSY